MKRMTLLRVAQTVNGAFGVLLDDDTLPFAVTLERPWLNNKKGESCIPDGAYLCQRVQSPKFGQTFEVTNVADRTSILFHKGNLMDDSHGCILVGEQFGDLQGKPGILVSGEGYGEFMQKLVDKQAFTLNVLTAKGGYFLNG